MEKVGKKFIRERRKDNRVRMKSDTREHITIELRKVKSKWAKSVGLEDKLTPGVEKNKVC